MTQPRSLLRPNGSIKSFIEDKGGTRPLQILNSKVELKNVSLACGLKKIIYNLSVKVDPGSPSPSLATLAAVSPP